MREPRISMGDPDKPHRLHETAVFFCFLCVLGAVARAAVCIIKRHRGPLLVCQDCSTAVPTCRRSHPSTTTHPGVWRAATVLSLMRVGITFLAMEHSVVGCCQKRDLKADLRRP